MLLASSPWNTEHLLLHSILCTSQYSLCMILLWNAKFLNRDTLVVNHSLKREVYIVYCVTMFSKGASSHLASFLNFYSFIRGLTCIVSPKCMYSTLFTISLPIMLYCLSSELLNITLVLFMFIFRFLLPIVWRYFSKSHELQFVLPLVFKVFVIGNNFHVIPF